LALRRPNRGLVFGVNRALETMEADGTLERLARRWLGA
jgi:ABC-type amino acid transport substrate-binding protein